MTTDPLGIDIHGHAIPAPFLDEVADRGLGGVTVERADGWVVTFPGRKPLRAIAGIMTDFDGRLEWLDGERMEAQYVAPWLDIHGQELPVADGRIWVRELNDTVAEAVSAHPGRLRAYATLHLEDPGVAAEELARAVNELGMVGTMIPTHPPRSDLADPGFDVLWEAAADVGAPVVLHPPTGGPSGKLFADSPMFKGTFGRGIDTMLAAADMIVGGVFDRHPDLVVVLVHGGGFLPYQVGRFDRDFGRGKQGDHLERLPSEYVAGLYFDSTLLAGPTLRYLADLAGADRIMIGSDYGARPRERGGVPLTHGLDTAEFEASERTAILRTVAERLFV